MDLAWDAFLQRYRPLAHALARSLTGKSGEAEDIVQEAALALWRACHEDESRIETSVHARNYYLRTVRNLCLAAGRRARAKPLSETEVPRSTEADALAVAAVEERQHALGRLLRELESRDAELIARRFLRGETLAQVSAATGIPVSTLHSRERVLLGRLRERLHREERQEQEDRA